MKRGLLLCALLFALAFPEILQAQKQELPSLLEDAGHCLVTSTQDWLEIGTSSARWGQFAWIEDRKSSPGERHIYLLARLDTGATQLFDMRLENRHGKRLLILENRFRLLATVQGDNSFEAVPAGGPRVEKLYNDAVVRIRARVSYDVQLSRFRQPIPNLICAVETTE